MAYASLERLPSPGAVGKIASMLLFLSFTSNLSLAQATNQPGAVATKPAADKRLYVFGDSDSDIGRGWLDSNGPNAVAYLAPRPGLTMQAATVQPEPSKAPLVPLWPDGAPGALGSTPTDIPTLSTFLPKSNPTRTAIIVMPGGGYGGLSLQKEGDSIAEWLNTRGIAAFVLYYRIAPKYHHPIEIGDAQRAIRKVRSQANDLGFAPDRIGIWGFSAGGHLAATAGTQFDVGDSSSTDPIQRQSSRPDFMVLAYPVISFMPPYAHIGSRNHLIGVDPSPELQQALSAERNVTSNTPPTFLFSTEDDATVQVMNSVIFYEALIKAGVPAELHLYRTGRHGAGLATNLPLLKGWPDVLAKWMAGNGWMTSDAAAIVTNP